MWTWDALNDGSKDLHGFSFGKYPATPFQLMKYRKISASNLPQIPMSNHIKNQATGSTILKFTIFYGSISPSTCVFLSRSHHPVGLTVYRAAGAPEIPRAKPTWKKGPQPKRATEENPAGDAGDPRGRESIGNQNHLPVMALKSKKF